MNAVECSGVEKAFGTVEALRGADLALAPGSLTALLGPSGCGKTTLLRAIAGFERIDAGTIEVSGQAVAGPGLHVAPERRRVTIVPQEQALFPHLSVAANVGYGLRRGSRRDEAVAAMLRLAGLGGLGDRMPHELSGGQQQRVALARALAPDPTVVLLDEPFGSLDAALRDEIRSEVAGVLRASSATALLVTHDQEEALSIADTVAVIRNGLIVQVGPPHEIYKRPADLWVANFVGRANVIPGEVHAAGSVRSALGTLALAEGPAGGPVDVVIRPEQLRISPAPGPAPAAPEGDGVVEDRRYFGHDAVVTVALADGARVLVRLPSVEPMPVGARVRVTCSEAVLAFGRP